MVDVLWAARYQTKKSDINKTKVDFMDKHG